MTVATKVYGFYSTQPMAPLEPGDPRHGTPNGYNNYGCRCAPCKMAYSAHQKRDKAMRAAGPTPNHVHGTENGYRVYKCKCVFCRSAHHLEYKRRYTPSPRNAMRRAETEAMYADHASGMSVQEVADKWSVSYHSVYSRFKHAGLPVLKRSVPAAAMYVDYCTGLSMQEVAAKWGVSYKQVQEGFKKLHLPLRPRKGGVAQPQTNGRSIPFGQRNAVMAAEAGQRKADAARDALPRTADPRHRMVLELRIAHPTDSMAALAARCTPPMSKDAYASHLRRALQNAGVS